MNRVITYFKSVELTTNELIVTTCCYITLIMNLPFLTRVIDKITSLENYNFLFLLSVPIFLLSIIIIFHCLFSFKWVTKPALILTVLISSLIFYATVNYGTVFDYGMVQNTIETDSAEATSYLNLYALGSFLLFGFIPSLAIYSAKIKYKSLLDESVSRLKLMSVFIFMIVLIASCFYSDYASVGRNNRELVNYITPYKTYDALYKYARNNYFYSPLAYKQLDTKPTISRTSAGQHVTVLVLGETARAQSFSLNGYKKPTNQYTRKQNVVSFSNMTSCGTATAVSVPCMFSRLNKENYDKRIANSQQNVIDIIDLAGADVLWVSNNNGSCKGVCARVETKKIVPDKNNPLCDGEYCFDEVLLKPLRDKLNNLTNNNTLIVLHMIGSHGPTYYKRYPKDKRSFLPDCPRSDIQNCTKEELINTYDNSIAYTDYVLSKIISQLSELTSKESVETSMLYVSDHGESLGEKGVFLHGLPYAFAPTEQTHIPMIYWDGPQLSSFNMSCLNNKSTTSLNHDFVFDILLDLMSVNSKTYNVDNDPFNQCKFHNKIARNSLNNEVKVGVNN